MVRKLIAYRWSALVIGAVAAAIGLFMLLQTDVKCGGRQMHPGDRCVVNSAGSQRVLTYAAQKAEDADSARYTLVFAGVLLLGSAGGFAMHLRSRSAGRVG